VSFSVLWRVPTTTDDFVVYMETDGNCPTPTALRPSPCQRNLRPANPRGSTGPEGPSGHAPGACSTAAVYSAGLPSAMRLPRPLSARTPSGEGRWWVGIVPLAKEFRVVRMSSPSPGSLADLPLPNWEGSDC